MGSWPGMKALTLWCLRRAWLREELPVFFFLRRSLTLLPRLECSDLGSPQFPPPGFKRLSSLNSQVAGITGAYHHTWLILVFLVEMGFHHVGQAGLKLLMS